MPGKSSNPVAWWSALEPAGEELFFHAPYRDDPRLGDVVQRWDGKPCKISARQPVLLGFPCDEGVRRNHGRPGAAAAPRAIREQLYRLTSWDGAGKTSVDLASVGLLDLGNIRVQTSLEQMQEYLGLVVEALLRLKAVPIIMGGGHETAFGHYLGYVNAGLKCGILNIDAHLDVRPFPNGGHSGSSFRQIIEHRERPLAPGQYAVIGVQRQSTAKAHCDFIQSLLHRIHWWKENLDCRELFLGEVDELGSGGGAVMVTVDADAFCQADVPGVSAPNPSGFPGTVWPMIAELAGQNPTVKSLELVEVNPSFDRDNQTARWAALGLRQFLVGFAARPA
ncbi:MAG TPA: formimidoylglutamase [Gemmataceae bacterium]|jgi:formiminoglutamase|nr:formimidoylglutamase [Gemmataceae bacterium]